MPKGQPKLLEKRGWKVGSVEEFLGLAPDEAAYVELKLRLAESLAARRTRRRLSQVRAARLLGTSQSRLSKMEAADPSVSLDLLIRSNLALGATGSELAREMADVGPQPRPETRKAESMIEPGESAAPIADLPAAEIEGLCRRHRVAELAVFGSLVRDDLTPASDIDFLVTFKPGAEKPWMGHFQSLEEELSRLLGHPVDLLDRRALEKSRNWIRRREILGSARVLYAA